MSISFLIVNYFTADYVEHLLASIRQNVQRYRYEILIFDNSSDPGEKKKLEKFDLPVGKVFFSDRNVGFVAANNALLESASEDLLVLINPDTLLLDNSIEDLFDFVQRHDEAGAVGPMLVNGDGSYQVSYYKFPTLWTTIREHILLARNHAYAYSTPAATVQECEVVKGACMVVRKSAIPADYLFDPALTMYSEEIDLCHRLVGSGLKNYYFPNSRIVHYGEKSSHQEQASEYSLYHYHRSKLIYCRKRWTGARFQVVRAILFVSLIEKSILLALVGRRMSAKIHWRALKRLWQDGFSPR